MMHPFFLAFSLMGLMVSASVFDTDDSDLQERSEEAAYLQALAYREALSRRGILDCKQHSQECSGFPKCCGTLQCFWENGYSISRSGVCVTCVDRSQKCQRDSQCCESLVCQKDNQYNIDGVCDTKKALAASCYRDEQCQSSECDISWYDRLKKKSGKCISKTKRWFGEANEYGYE